nr:hypothetical protein CFP56_17967 [Quercus suber]
MTDHHQEPNQKLPSSSKKTPTQINTSNTEANFSGQKVRYRNPPDAANPDPATLREQWKNPIKNFPLLLRKLPLKSTPPTPKPTSRVKKSDTGTRQTQRIRTRQRSVSNGSSPLENTPNGTLMLGAPPFLLVSPSLRSVGSSRALILCLLSTISPLSLPPILLLLLPPLPMMQMKLAGDGGCHSN